MRSMALAALLFAACGGDARTPYPIAAHEREVLERAFDRAARDSVAMARAGFALRVTLETSMSTDDSTVRVIDWFGLMKRPGSAFSVVDRTQHIEGDRELLGDMYSFENSKGELRSETEARLTSVGFGADERRILDDLLDGRLSLEGPIVDSVPADRHAVRIIRFSGEDLRGALELDSATLAVTEVTVRRSSSAIVGGYVYTMSIMMSHPSARLRLPMRMMTTFDYERLTSSGSGVVRMTIDTTR